MQTAEECVAEIVARWEKRADRMRRNAESLYQRGNLDGNASFFIEAKYEDGIALTLRECAGELRVRYQDLIARLEALARRRPAEAAGLYTAAALLREEVGNDSG